jgi:probable rRNA maturation factor
VRGEVAIALVSDRRMRALNHQYRGKDAATDVLSFAAQTKQPAVDSGSRRTRVRTPRLPASGGHLGDIVIARGVAERQAREAGHGLATELRVLALHGLLHLVGYDHESAADKDRMARAEARLRRRGGLKDTVIARAERSVERTIKRLRPARPAGGKRGGAAPPSARRARVRPRPHEK